MSVPSIRRDFAGSMDQRIEIIQLSKTVESDYGGMTLGSSSTLATVWAKIEYRETGSDEEVKAGQIDLVQMVKITMRYRSDVKPTMLVRHDSLYYDILSVLPQGRQDYMILECKQRGEGWNPTVT